MSRCRGSHVRIVEYQQVPLLNGGFPIHFDRGLVDVSMRVDRRIFEFRRGGSPTRRADRIVRDPGVPGRDRPQGSLGVNPQGDFAERASRLRPRSIDDPAFRSPLHSGPLTDDEPVLSLEVNGDARAYPIEILVWHEIVNDTVGGVPVAVTYCPLCNTGVVFRRPVVAGRPVTFGVSGRLYQSNLIMYDRTTDSLWPQELGRATDGPLAGTKLHWIASQLVSWSDWRAAHPDGKVLRQPPGPLAPPHTVGASYGLSPYPYYDRVGSRPPYFHGKVDPRLPPKERVVGIAVGRHALAVPYSRLQAAATGGWAVIAVDVGGEPAVVVWHGGAVSPLDGRIIASSRKVGATGVFSPRLGGRRLTLRVTGAGLVDAQTGSRWNLFGEAVAGPLEGKRLTPIVAGDGFWFSWTTAHPRSAIWRP